MQLSREQIKNINQQPGLIIPDERLFQLPEKVLQFGTGVLLRGLPDYFIDKANRQGIFNGRVVMVKSTKQGNTDAYDKQDNLYTLLVRGIVSGEKTEENIINSSISRVITADEHWDHVLKCAHNPEMRIIISNTTEVGITLTEDDIRLSPPQSFPGKLLAFLYERYKACNGSPDGGMVIIPTELVTDNGPKLRSILTELVGINRLENEFISWMLSANHFCNSLVDRIVPGKLSGEDSKAIESKLGYRDELMIMAEPFRLWAIESADPKVKQVLSFAESDSGVVITEDIGKFRELKLRLLNGTHSFSCGLAHLSGFVTVKEAMNNKSMSDFVGELMAEEITAISGDDIPNSEACLFAEQVLDRFRNPYIDHAWLNITMQYSAKMKLRNIPLLQKYYNKTGHVPERMALGFAAYLLFMKCQLNSKGQYTGYANNATYAVHDDSAAYFAERWKETDTDSLVDTILADKDFWGADLSRLEGFAALVKKSLHSFMRKGVPVTLQEFQARTLVG